MTESESHRPSNEVMDFISAIGRVRKVDVFEIYRAIEPLVDKAKRKSWLAGRDAAAENVIHWEDHELIMALEPPEDL